MKNAELRKQIEELKKDIYRLLKKGTWLEEQEAKFKWNSFFERESILSPWLKDFIAGLKKAEPLPHIEDLRNAGFIHNEPWYPFKFGGLEFQMEQHTSSFDDWFAKKKEEPKASDYTHNTGRMFAEAENRTEPFGNVKPRKPEKDFTTGNNAFKHLQQTKYPEGILSFKDGDTIFNQINFNHPVTYNQWVEEYMRLNIPIHSVKNSKGEVITVGDSIKIYSSNGYIGTIKSFRIVPVYGEEKKSVLYANCEVIGDHHIDYLTKVEKPQPSIKYPEGILSFIDKDGDNVSKGDSLEYQEWCALNFEKKKPASKINSVRNSKGIVFTVSDFAEKPSYESGEILSFDIDASHNDIHATIRHKSSHTIRLRIDELTKVEKQQPSWKDQIVAFRSQNLIYRYSSPLVILGRNDWVQNHLNQKNEIFTVKNKAGVEFSVGDDVCNIFECAGVIQGRIISFRILNNAEIIAEFVTAPSWGIERLTKAKELMFISKDNYHIREGDDYYQITKDGTGFGKNSAQPPAQFYANNPAIRFKHQANAQIYIRDNKPKPLFKTEDGFDVFEGDYYYSVNKKTLSIGKFESIFAVYSDAVFIRFKEKSNAEKYIAENRKSISWRELEDFILRATWNQKINTDRDFLMIYYEDFINRFKPKS